MGAGLRNTLSGPGALRLLLALAVFEHHIASIAIGAAAVHVFFALSGYWIAKMWSERYSKAQSPYQVYITSRVWRLIPIFWLMIVLAMVADALVGRQANISAASIISSIFILGYATLSNPALGPAWSLDIEMQFYLVAPVLVWAIARWGWAAVLVTATGSAAAALIGWRENVIPYMILFAVGVFAARVDWRPNRLVAFVPMAVVGIALLALLLSPWRGVLIGGSHAGAMHKAFNPALNVLIAAAVIPYAMWTTTRRGGALDGMFADLSYVVYLLHWVALKFLGAAILGMSTAERLVTSATTVLATLGLAWILWRFYDQPINSMRARWVRKMIDTPAAGDRIVAEEPASP